MDRVQWHALRQVLLTALLMGCIALGVSPFIDEHLNGRTLAAAFFIGSMSTLAFLGIEALVKRRLGRHWPLLAGFLLGILLDVLAISAIQILAVFLFGLNSDRIDLHEMVNRADFQLGLVAILALVLAAQFIQMIRAIVGKGVLWRLGFGIYRRSRELERFFMFIDIQGSTRLAESLGHQRFLAFLNEFYRDLDRAAISTRAEIHKYAGDGAILVWRPRSGSGNAGPVEFFYLLKNLIAERESRYRKLFGEPPRFRAGLHFGKAVVAELGHSKKEIAYLGDVMNTTARLEQACKPAGVDLVVSQAALERISLPAGVRVARTWRAVLRGKEAATVFSGLEDGGQGHGKA